MMNTLKPREIGLVCPFFHTSYIEQVQTPFYGFSSYPLSKAYLFILLCILAFTSTSLGNLGRFFHV
ncbi:hypothetical protein ACFSCX_13235 [Bacillus salitolerans]|uniref:Uncharacterized protein n=1 Tax=Bacillus salitolerans TaxID=1437434 RepID=A0ABW4LSL9_9BACI